MFSDQCIANRPLTNRGCVRFGDLPTTSRWQQAAAVTLLLSLLSSSQVAAEAPSTLTTLIQNSCIDCHDQNTETRLDFTELDQDFKDVNTFHAWVKIVDRIQKGEMPPAQQRSITYLFFFVCSWSNDSDYIRTMNKSLTRLKMLNQYSEPLLPSSILFQEALGFKPND